MAVVSSSSSQVNMPEPGVSFAFIYSVEDPKESTQNTGIAAQVAQPNTKGNLLALLLDQSCSLPVPARLECFTAYCIQLAMVPWQADSYAGDGSRRLLPATVQQEHEAFLGLTG